MTAKRTSEPRVARDTPNLAEERFHRIRQFVRTLRVWKYRYDLNTALYMLDPWERAVFNVILLCVLAYIAYCAYYRTLHPWFESIALSV